MSFGSMPSAGFETASGSQQEAAGPGESGPDNIVGAAFKLQAEEGATVTATFPFFGDPEGGQLTFQIGDHIKVFSIHGVQLPADILEEFIHLSVQNERTAREGDKGGWHLARSSLTSDSCYS